MSAADADALLAALLAAVRISGLFLVAPLFGHLALPVRVRGGLAFAMAIALVPALPAPGVAATADLPRLGLAVVGEAAIGVALGFSARLVFDAVGLFGAVFAMQGGLGAASVIDPTSGGASTTPSALFEAIAVLIYLAIDGHHALLRAAALSFDAMPPGGGGLAASSLLALAGLGTHVFALAVQLSAPVMVAMLLANVALGVLGRALPEMNLMMVQIPAHVLFGLAFLLASASPLGRVLAQALAEWSGRAAGVVLGAP